MRNAIRSFGVFITRPLEPFLFPARVACWCVEPGAFDFDGEIFEISF